MTLPTPDVVRPSRGGRPRDPGRDGVIRAASLRLLAEVGYRGLTMDAVAAEAGVGKATIYRRWRTKQDLVVDTIAELSGPAATAPDTGSLAGDLRVLLRSLVTVLTGPLGATAQSLLPAVPHSPALADAFRSRLLGRWTAAFGEVCRRAEQRGEVAPGLACSPRAEAASALLVQRWPVTGGPVDDAYADAVLDTVVLPLLREGAPATV